MNFIRNYSVCVLDVDVCTVCVGVCVCVVMRACKASV